MTRKTKMTKQNCRENKSWVRKGRWGMWPGPTRVRRCGPGAGSGVGLSPYAVGSHTEVPKPGEVVHSTALPAEQSWNTDPEKSTGKLLV